MRNTVPSPSWEILAGLISHHTLRTGCMQRRASHPCELSAHTGRMHAQGMASRGVSVQEGAREGGTPGVRPAAGGTAPTQQVAAAPAPTSGGSGWRARKSIAAEPQFTAHAAIGAAALAQRCAASARARDGQQRRLTRRPWRLVSSKVSAIDCGDGAQWDPSAQLRAKVPQYAPMP